MSHSQSFIIESTTILRGLDVSESPARSSQAAGEVNRTYRAEIDPISRGDQLCQVLKLEMEHYDWLPAGLPG